MANRIHKIAQLLHTGNVIGGTEVATLEIARLARRNDFTSTIFFPDGHLPRKVEELFANDGFETKAFRPIEPELRSLHRYLINSFALAREFRRNKIELVHCCDLMAAYYGALAGRLAGARVVCQIRCSFPNINGRFSNVLRLVDHFAFVSNASRATFGLKVPDSRSSVIYDGIETGHIIDPSKMESIHRKFGLTRANKVIGMVARVAPVKDFLTLALAAKKVIEIEENARFLIVGDISGKYEDHYREVLQILEANNVSSHFIFTDFQVDVASFLDVMDVFVLSSHSEGLPLVLLEAMAHDVPVTATAVGGVPEIVEHGSTGLLHTHGDHHQLSDQILKLMYDEELRDCLIRKASSSLNNCWTRERFERDILRLYRGVIANRPPRSVTFATENKATPVEFK